MAKKFTFRAEPVLKLREQRERIARRRMAEVQGRVGQIQQRIADIREQLRQQDAAVRQGVLTGTVDVQYMSLYRRHVMTLHRALIEQAQQLQQAAGEMETVRVELVEAVKQRKVMAKLKDKLRQRYLDELARQEAKELDEMSSMRFGHSRLYGEG